MNDRTRPARTKAVPASRLARLSHLGSMTAGVAGNMAMNGMAQLGQGKRPSMRDLFLTPANIRRVTDRLAEMRGAAMKIGQLVSMDTGDVLPPELSEIMARLRADAHIMPPAQLKKVLNANWPDGWLKSFERFDVHPIAAASIGQVHRAQLRDGRDLAIKVQYPGVAESIDSDVANVGALIRMSGLLPQGFDLAPYMEEARQQLHEETDYQLEGRHLTEFRALLDGDDRFLLPALQDDWTTPNILAMSYVDSVPIDELATCPQEARDRVAEDLIDLMLRELFGFGVMQTDPNFANYRFQPETGRIVLLDFGATRRIDLAIVELYRDIMVAGLSGDRDNLHRLALRLGLYLPETEAKHQEQVLAMIEMVFDEIGSAHFFDFGQTQLPRRMQAAGMHLAETGFVPPPLPIDALFLQRKFGGMFLLAAKLGARVPVLQLLKAAEGLDRCLSVKATSP